MESLREKLLEVIAGAMPDTDAFSEFCGSDAFVTMMDKVIKTIVTHITADADQVYINN